MRRLSIATLALLALTPAAWAEKLTVAVSTPEIQINSNFTGTNVTVFGVIERDAGTVARAAPYQVAALVLGPPETVVARRKDRVLGVWLNGASETLVSAPTFYSLATTPGLELPPIESGMSTNRTCSPACRPMSYASLRTRLASAMPETVSPARAFVADDGSTSRVPISSRAVENTTVPSASQAVAESTCCRTTGSPVSCSDNES